MLKLTKEKQNIYIYIHKLEVNTLVAQRIRFQNEFKTKFKVCQMNQATERKRDEGRRGTIQHEERWEEGEGGQERGRGGEERRVRSEWGGITLKYHRSKFKNKSWKRIAK